MLDNINTYRNIKDNYKVSIHDKPDNYNLNKTT